MLDINKAEQLLNKAAQETERLQLRVNELEAQVEMNKTASQDDELIMVKAAMALVESYAVEPFENYDDMVKAGRRYIDAHPDERIEKQAAPVKKVVPSLSMGKASSNEQVTGYSGSDWTASWEAIMANNG